MGKKGSPYAFYGASQRYHTLHLCFLARRGVKQADIQSAGRVNKEQRRLRRADGAGWYLPPPCQRTRMDGEIEAVKDI